MMNAETEYYDILYWANVFEWGNNDHLLDHNGKSAEPTVCIYT